MTSSPLSGELRVAKSTRRCEWNLSIAVSDPMTEPSAAGNLAISYAQSSLVLGTQDMRWPNNIRRRKTTPGRSLRESKRESLDTEADNTYGSTVQLMLLLFWPPRVAIAGLFAMAFYQESSIQPCILMSNSQSFMS